MKHLISIVVQTQWNYMVVSKQFLPKKQTINYVKQIWL